MEKSMLAVVKEDAAPGLTVTRRPIPDPCGPGEVLIQVLATSICGTDLHIYQYDDWSKKRIKPPFIAGHEFCGRVVEVGEGVTHIQVGDIVSAETHIVCGQCEFCRQGMGHICQETQIIGVDRDGCFAEYIKMPVTNLIVNDPSIDPKYLSIQEPIGNAIHTMLHFDIVAKTVAIVGCGPIGLMAVNVAKAVGARKIIAIELNPYRIELAKKLGADVVIHAQQEDVIARVLEETDGMGVDVVGEFSGNKQALEAAFKYVKSGGKISILGIYNEAITIDISQDVVFKGITIYGVTGRKMFENWYQVKGLVESGRLDLDTLITHVFPLTEIDEAMKVMASGNSGKIVLIP